MALDDLFFAWVGGTIPTNPVNLITSGNTHGGIVQTFTLTGDLTSGQTVMLHIATASGLELGALHSIAGPGLLTGTLATYYGGPQLVLSTAATSSVTSGTYALTKPVTVGVTTASLSGGSSSVTGLSDVSELLPGQVYGAISGYLPRGALFTYGGGTTIQLHDIQGNTVNAYSSVSNTSITITQVGGSSVATLITGVQSMAGLTPGLRYNIVAGGLPAGTTFVAPASGNQITTDQAATASAINVPLIITGPRVTNAPFDPVGDARLDEDIVFLDITQEEGSFAKLTIDIKNPKIGFLMPGRYLWCWVSTQTASGVVPLFNGRLIGVPERQSGEIVRLSFLARPDDYDDQKQAVAASLRVLPWFDPVWLEDKVNDPDTVLEAYSYLWHTDRVSLVVTASDVIQGEDGTVTFTEDQILYEGFQIRYDQPPLTHITVTGTVTYNQEGDGELDITSELYHAFSDAGCNLYGYPVITTLTDGIKTSWPTPGRSIGSGWSLSADSGIDDATWVRPLQFNSAYNTIVPNLGVSVGNAPNISAITSLISTLNSAVIAATLNFKLTNIALRRFSLQWQASRKRTETVSVVIPFDVQQVLSDPAGADEQTVSLSSQFVGNAIDPGGGVPIEDLRRNTYFKTARGQSSFEYLLLLGRAKGRYRARCVRVEFELPWDLAYPLTLRQNVTITTRYVPGGSATGKVIGLKLTWEAGTGRIGTVTVGCTVGHGNPSTGPSPANTYVADGYVAPGYQATIGGQIALLTGELLYEPFDDFAVDDDGLNLFYMTPQSCIVGFGVTKPAANLTIGADVYLGNSVAIITSDPSQLDLGRQYLATGAFILPGTTAVYNGEGTITLSQAPQVNQAYATASPMINAFIHNLGFGQQLGPTAGTKVSASLQLTAPKLYDGLVSYGLLEQVGSLFSSTQGQGAVGVVTASDPLQIVREEYTTARVALVPVAGQEFTTYFFPSISQLALPKGINLETG